jgi:hypothetical protein
MARGNYTIVCNFVWAMDKLGITRDPDAETPHKFNGVVDFTDSEVYQLVELHGGNDEDVREHT